VPRVGNDSTPRRRGGAMTEGERGAGWCFRGERFGGAGLQEIGVAWGSGGENESGIRVEWRGRIFRSMGGGVGLPELTGGLVCLSYGGGALGRGELAFNKGLSRVGERDIYRSAVCGSERMWGLFDKKKGGKGEKQCGKIQPPFGIRENQLQGGLLSFSRGKSRKRTE